MKLAKLKNKRAELKKQGKAIQDAADKADRDLNDEETESLDTILGDITALDAEIAAEEARLERLRILDDGGDNVVQVPAVPVDAEEQARGGFASTAEFALSVCQAGSPGGSVDNRLVALQRPGAAPSNFHQESGGSAGEGYLVPPAMRDRIWELVIGTPDLLSLSEPEPTSSRQVNGISDETTPWGSSGIQANWRSEGAQMSASKIAQNPRRTVLHELYAFVLATEELLEDAPLLNARIERGAARAINWKASDAIMWGTGAGQPLGFMNSNCLVSVAKESGQAADTIVAANVLKMLSRLLAVPGAQPLWLLNSQTIPQIAQMTIGNQPAFVAQGGLPGALSGTLLGYPILMTEHCTALGDLGDIALTDMQGYESLRRSTSPEFATSMHLYFDFAMQAFRWMFRFGGQPYLSAPVAGAKSGSDTKSHFVTLAERA